MSQQNPDKQALLIRYNKEEVSCKIREGRYPSRYLRVGTLGRAEEWH